MLEPKRSTAKKKTANFFFNLDMLRPIHCSYTYIEVVFTSFIFRGIALPAVVVVMLVFQVPISDHGAQIICRVVDVVLPSIVVPEGDGGQVGTLKIARTRIHCSNIGQFIAPDLQRNHMKIENQYN